MTDHSITAFFYSGNSGNRFNRNALEHYIFVNEVLESKKLQTLELVSKPYNDVNGTKPKNQFEKHAVKLSQRPAEDVYIVDDEGRRYINTPDRPRGSDYIALSKVYNTKIFDCNWKEKLNLNKKKSATNLLSILPMKLFSKQLYINYWAYKLIKYN